MPKRTPAESAAVAKVLRKVLRSGEGQDIDDAYFTMMRVIRALLKEIREATNA